MIIKYYCNKCNKTRAFSSVQKDKVLCKGCGSEMKLKKDNISINSMTTEEARFLADEALFCTVEDRVSGKTRVRHT